MFKRVCLSVFLAILLVVPAFSLGVSQSVMDAVRPITYKGANICTATKINDQKDLWLTAQHCVPPEDFKGEMIKIDGTTVQVVARSPLEKDLAILFVPGGQGKALKFGEAPILGQSVKMWGHPIGVPIPQLFAGTVSSLDLPFPVVDDEGNVVSWEHYTMFNMVVCGGNSGSSILNEAEEIVSVMQIGVGQRPCMSWSGGAPYVDLKAFAGKYFGI